MLLTLSDFPGEQWEETGDRDQSSAPARIGIDKAGTAFSTMKWGGAIQVIYRFGTIEDARMEYEDAKNWWFNLGPKNLTWTIPAELQGINLNADDYKLECAEVNVKPMFEKCSFVGLYKYDVVQFNAHLILIKYDDLINLLKKMDQNMLACMEAKAK
jgi:hypothetical protein